MRLRIHLDMFYASLYFFLGKDELRPFHRLCRKEFEFEPSSEEEVLRMAGCTVGSAIWLKELPTTPETIGFLAHEISHLMDNLKEARGISCTESRAYVTGHLVTRVLGAVAKARRK